MSTENNFSVLHIDNIPQETRGLWIAASRKQGQKLTEWVIEKLNDAAVSELDLDKAPPIDPADFKLLALNQIDDGVTYDSFINNNGEEIVIWHDPEGKCVEMNCSCYFGESEHEREQAFIRELYSINNIKTD